MFRKESERNDKKDVPAEPSRMFVCIYVCCTYLIRIHMLLTQFCFVFSFVHSFVHSHSQRFCKQCFCIRLNPFICLYIIQLNWNASRQRMNEKKERDRDKIFSLVIFRLSFAGEFYRAIFFPVTVRIFTSFVKIQKLFIYQWTFFIQFLPPLIVISVYFALYRNLFHQGLSNEKKERWFLLLLLINFTIIFKWKLKNINRKIVCFIVFHLHIYTNFIDK